MPWIICEINLILTWSQNCVLSVSAVNHATTFAIIHTKIYVPVVTLSTRNKRTIYWNKNQSKTTTHKAPNQYLGYLIDPNFQGVNRFFALPFNADDRRIGHSRYYYPTAKVKDYNVLIEGKNFFDQPIKSYIKTSKNIQKNATGQGDDYTTGCLLDYNYFRKHYKTIAIDLSKHQALDGNPKAMQEINFYWISKWCK